jgi:hypothetical protein
MNTENQEFSTFNRFNQKIIGPPRGIDDPGIFHKLFPLSLYLHG